MTLAALPNTMPPRPASTRPWRRPPGFAVGLLVGWLLQAPAPLAAQIEVERVELSVRIDAPLHSLYTQARLLLRNRGPRSPAVLELAFPAPLGPRVRPGAVWDRKGELPWRSDPVEADSTRPLRVELRSPLAPGKRLVVVVSYDLNLKGFLSSGAALSVSRDGAQLPTTGWYPLPEGSPPASPQALRLTVRLPKEWQVTAPVKLKQLRDGTALASYELRLRPVEPGQWLLRAGQTLPP